MDILALISFSRPNIGESLLVEINPRLTTSYIGYRKLTNENLMEHILFPERFPKPILWKDQTVQFSLQEKSVNKEGQQ